MPIITKISEQKKRENRRNIFIDGAFAFGVNLNVVARFRLREGLELSLEQVTEIEAGEVRQECFDKGLEAPPPSPRILVREPIPAGGKAKAVGNAKDRVDESTRSAVHRPAGCSLRTPVLPYPFGGGSWGSSKTAYRPASNHPWRQDDRTF